MTAQEDRTNAVVFGSPNELKEAVGRDLGATAWMTVDPGDVSAFVRATGTPDAEGEVPALFVLSLTNLFLPQLLDVHGATSGVNYGAQRIRYPVRIRPGDRIRATARLVEAVDVPGAVQTTVEITVEVEGSGEPACTVESLSRWML